MFLVTFFKGLIKEFPIHELLAATKIEAVSTAVTHIFSHLKKTKNAHFPIQRYLGLVEAVARDMCAKVLGVSNYRLSPNIIVYHSDQPRYYASGN